MTKNVTVDATHEEVYTAKVIGLKENEISTTSTLQLKLLLQKVKQINTHTIMF